MKIGILGTIWLNIPPKNYGGTEQVIFNLAYGLTEQGHDVTLFGPKTANVPCKVIPTVDVPLREQNISWNDISYHLSHITKAFDLGEKFDILHVHVNRDQDFMSFPLALFSPTPVLFTFHGLLPQKKVNPAGYSLLTKYQYLPFTSISNSQRAGLPINFIQTTYNSIDLREYPYSETAEDYFLWLGKVNPRKGTKEAILAAKKAGVKLIVAGVIEKGISNFAKYYHEEVKPLIDNKQIIWVGEVCLEQKVAFLSHAKALLNPILWKEPFGLVMVEAQATGTPVIANNKGSAPEVIENNKTGFLVNSLDQMAKKVADVNTLSRKACRNFVEKNFSIPTMVASYVTAYEKTISSWSDIQRKQKEYIKMISNIH